MSNNFLVVYLLMVTVSGTSAFGKVGVDCAQLTIDGEWLNVEA